MAPVSPSAVPLGRSYALAAGPRVRLRLVGPGDAPAIRALFARQGVGVDELDVARLVRFDPRRRAVICADTLVGSSETIFALGAIDLDAATPDTIVVEAELSEALSGLIVDALVSRVRARAGVGGHAA